MYYVVCFFHVCLDGDIDDSEINLIKTDSFFSKYYSKVNESLFVNLIKDDSVSFIDLIKNEFPKTLKSLDNNLKINFIESLIRLVVADGVVDDNEITVLNLIGESMGFNHEKVLDLMKTTIKNNNKN